MSGGVAEWAALNTPIQPGDADKKGEITVKEATSVFWLGLARIFIDEDGHITKGEVQLNTKLLEGYGAAAADQVLCQELGHVLGLDHDRVASDSCMNDQATLGDATSPGFHDGQQLGIIYAHADVIPDEEPDGGGPPCSKNPSHPNCKPEAGHWMTIDVFPIPDDD